MEYYKKLSAERGASLSHRDNAILKKAILPRPDNLVDQSIFKFTTSEEDRRLDETVVNLIPDKIITEEMKLFYDAGHLSSTYKFLSIRGELMLARQFYNTTHQGDTQLACHEQKCLSFIGTHANTVTAVGMTFLQRVPYSVCVYPGKPLDHKIMRSPWILSDIIQFASDLANGLCHIHRSNMIHLSLSPTSVYKSEDSFVIGGFELSCR